AGLFYAPISGGFQVIAAPVGATITILPSGCSPVVVSDATYYYYGGTFYVQSGSGYQVVAPPPGAVVENLPTGTVQVQQNEQTYMKYNETLYQPVLDNGEDAYEVVQL
ncbi:MAG: DUF6515 family protein, partial [bacterium]